MNPKYGLLFLLTASLISCSTVDDYLLGKDNTPAPKALKPITSKVNIAPTWTVAVGASQKSNYSKLNPLILGPMIYSIDYNGNLEALNKKSGKIIWNKKINHQILSGISAGHGVLVLTTSNSEVVGLRLQNGEELWRKKVSDDVLAKPVITGNRVLAKTIDGNLYAFNLQTGKRLWLSEHGAPALVLKASSAPVLLNDKTAIVGYSDGKLDAIDLDTGRTLWQRSIAYATGASDVERLVDIDADPIVRGNSIILGSYQGYLGAVSLDDGQFIWRKPASVYKNMVLQGNTLYLTDSQDVLWAINHVNGQVKWKQAALKAHDLTEPVVSGNRLYVGDKTGMLHVLDTANGEFIARAPMAGPVRVAPFLSGNNLYVLTSNGKLSRYSVS